MSFVRPPMQFSHGNTSLGEARISVFSRRQSSFEEMVEQVIF